MKLSHKAKVTLRLILPVIVLGVSGLVAYVMIASKSKPRRVDPAPTVTHVVAKRLVREDYQVTIHSQGTVNARTESTLIPQVSGNIDAVAENFREGGFFEKGDVLVEIDRSDYETAKVEAEAALAQAKLRLAEQEARAEQAKREWETLGEGEEASPLVLRQPQLAEARAAVAAAQANLERAKRNLERTRIKAPYAGRILRKQVDVGQYVSPGTVLAEVYAVDYAEIRLPLTNDQLAYVDLPELYRGEKRTEAAPGLRVLLRAPFGGKEYTWEGRIVRTEGSMDISSRQLFVVAQVDDPYARKVKGRPPLKVGMFVNAEIQGDILEEVIVVPRETLRQGRELLLINDENRLERRRVDVIWSDEENVVVRESLEEGDLLCLTPMTFAAQGAKVQPSVENEEADAERTAPSTETKLPTGATEKKGTS